MPWCWLAYRVYLETLQTGAGLGADPVEGLIHYLGEWSLIVLLSAFSVTPLSRQFKWPMLIRSRRLIGVVAFVFVAVHTLVFAIFYAELKWPIFLREVVERPYITLGMASVVILMLLTLTSTTRLAAPTRTALEATASLGLSGGTLGASPSALAAQRRLYRRVHLQPLGGGDGGGANSSLARRPA